MVQAGVVPGLVEVAGTETANRECTRGDGPKGVRAMNLLMRGFAVLGIMVTLIALVCVGAWWYYKNENE